MTIIKLSKLPKPTLERKHGYFRIPNIPSAAGEFTPARLRPTPRPRRPRSPRK